MIIYLCPQITKACFNAYRSKFSTTPTIINNCPGLKDTLPEKWPLKVNNNNVTDFVQLILSLENTTHYEEYVNIAYEYAKTNFSIEKMQYEYEQIYEKHDK